MIFGKGVPKYSVHSLLVNIPPAIRSSTQTGNLKLIMIIRIKQIVIPVGQMSRQMLKSEYKLIPKSKRQGIGLRAFINASATQTKMNVHMHAYEEGKQEKRPYVNSLPAETLVLAIRTIRLSSSPTLIILA